MANRDLTFIDQNWADDIPLQTMKSLYPDAVEVSDIRDFVNKVLQALNPGDCIAKLTLFAHGSPGSVVVGTGRHGRATGLNSMALRNSAVWRREIRRLQCRFCQPDGRFEIKACGAGGDTEGARLLRMIAQDVVCALVAAPVGTISVFTEEGWVDSTMQEVRGSSPPESVPLPDPIPNELNRASDSSSLAPRNGDDGFLVAGRDFRHGKLFAPGDILSARFYVGDFPVSAEPSDLKSRKAHTLSRSAVGQLRQAFIAPRISWRGFDLLEIQGYLQLLVKQKKKSVWLSPGGILGGCMFYCPFMYDSTLVYELSPNLRKWLQASYSKAMRALARRRARSAENTRRK